MLLLRGGSSSLGSGQRASRAALCDRASRMAEKGQVSEQNICPSATARAVRPSLYPISRLGRGFARSADREAAAARCSSGCESIFTAGDQSRAGPSPLGSRGGVFGGYRQGFLGSTHFGPAFLAGDCRREAALELPVLRCCFWERQREGKGREGGGEVKNKYIAASW